MRWLKRLLGGEEAEAPPVFYGPDSDEMQAAFGRARETFRYFWREMSWEQRRIIPGCTIAHVKLQFEDRGHVEHMWVADVDCDGVWVVGTLANRPDRLLNVREGDVVERPIEELGDWMYAVAGGEVCGGYTVNLMRAQMTPQQRRAHDDAWGLDFGDPETIALVPSGWGAPDDPHPMAVNAAEGLRDSLREDRSLVDHVDARGWTPLHFDALGGNRVVVDVLLEHGADPGARTPEGHTPADLADRLGWTELAAFLRAKERAATH